MSNKEPKFLLSSSLVRAREEAGLTQVQVRRKFPWNIGQPDLSKIENGSKHLRALELHEFSKLYNKPFQYFFAWDKQTVSAIEEVVLPESSLELYKEYSREDAQRVFDPEGVETERAAKWAKSAILSLGENGNDFVLFVSLDRNEGEKESDEYITDSGVFIWGSQKSKTFSSPIIRKLIQHDHNRNAVHLFVRTREKKEYAYLGKLKYLAHDSERDRPVFFRWQILNWMPNRDQLTGDVSGYHRRCGFTIEVFNRKAGVWRC